MSALLHTSYAVLLYLRVDGGRRVTGRHSAVEDALHEPLQGNITTLEIHKRSQRSQYVSTAT